MQELLASVDGQKFEIEIALEQQLGAQSLPFPGMDSRFLFYFFNYRSACWIIQFYLVYRGERATKIDC
jgi:hypothetical protein